MAIFFRSEKTKPSKTRKLPFLPRVGFFLEVGNRRITFKQAPILEAVAELVESQKMDLLSFLKFSKQQLDEIQFTEEKPGTTIDTQAKDLDSK